MTDLVYVATRKGLFEIANLKGVWTVTDAHFLGDPVSAVLRRGDKLFAALDTGHFGAKLWVKDGVADWRELDAPAFPPKPDDAEDDPHPWTVEKIWNITPGGVDGRLWIGTMAGGLFRSDDHGETWALNDPLWRTPERREWMGVAGGERPGLSAVLVNPADPANLTIGVSCAGVWISDDTGASWSNVGDGFYNEYMPPDQRSAPLAQDIHQLAMCRAHPNVVWCQHHSGIYRSTDGGANWSELKNATPSAFGFAVVAHPTDPETAWFVPAIKDEKRYPVDAKLVVMRTRDGGATFEVLSDGLPQHHAYDLVYRHALAVDGNGTMLAFGSTSGGFWISENGGDSWIAPDARLPPVAAVAFAP